MKYFKVFDEHTEYESYIDNDPILPNVSICEEEEHVHYNDEVDYSQQYLTFNILSAGTINWRYIGGTLPKTISYSKNDGDTWTNITSTSGGVSFNVSAGDKVIFKGTNTTYATGETAHNGFSSSTATYNVEGNIMSLSHGDNFATAKTLTNNYQFVRIFAGSKVISAKNLILPATSLTPFCYTCLFWNCSQITTAPKSLPSMSLASNCYQFMFRDCLNLLTSPELPATTLAGGCYNGMFRVCTKLKVAPILPAPTLATNCYNQMFSGCSQLNEVTCLAKTAPTSTSYTSDWLTGVASSGTFYKAASATWGRGTSYVPSAWTLTNAT